MFLLQNFPTGCLMLVFLVCLVRVFLFIIQSFLGNLVILVLRFLRICTFTLYMFWTFCLSHFRVDFLKVGLFQGKYRLSTYVFSFQIFQEVSNVLQTSWSFICANVLTCGNYLRISRKSGKFRHNVRCAAVIRLNPASFRDVSEVLGFWDSEVLRF